MRKILNFILKYYKEIFGMIFFGWGVYVLRNFFLYLFGWLLYVGVPLTIIMIIAFKMDSFIYKSFYEKNRWVDWICGIILVPSVIYAVWWLGCFIILGLIDEYENHGLQLLFFVIALALMLYLLFVNDKAVNRRKYDDEAKLNSDEN